MSLVSRLESLARNVVGIRVACHTQSAFPDRAQLGLDDVMMRRAASVRGVSSDTAAFSHTAKVDNGQSDADCLTPQLHQRSSSSGNADATRPKSTAVLQGMPSHLKNEDPYGPESILRKLAHLEAP